jgi:hypothetical protein
MAATKTIDDDLDRKDRVVAVVDMPGIPAGTKGKVTFVEGFTWIRYWVRFENGVVRGSINRNKLVRPAEWGRIQERRALGITDEDEDDAGDAAPSASADGATGDAVAAGASVNGVSIPAHLLERSVNRRQVLGK